MRDELIAKKKREVQDQLEWWASENNILKAGEQIVFSIRVESQPVVVEDSVSSYWDMRPEVFFSADRMRAMGVPKSHATAIAHRIDDVQGDWPKREEDPRYPTMRAFLNAYPSREKMLKIKLLGKVLIDHMEDALRRANLVTK